MNALVCSNIDEAILDSETARWMMDAGDPRNWEQTKYSRAKLSSLGEKLLGSKKW